MPFAYVNWAKLVGVKADFVKKEMRLTIDVKLDDKSLAMRDVLAELAEGERPLLVTFDRIEPSLGDLPLFAAAADVADVAAAVAGLRQAGARLATEEKE